MKKILVLIFACNFLIQCSSPEHKENVPENKAVKDTVMVPDTNKIAIRSEITCPNCSFKKTEDLPTEVCLITYTCEKCKTVMHPKAGDCCVFCTYGDQKCPSKQ